MAIVLKTTAEEIILGSCNELEESESNGIVSVASSISDLTEDSFITAVSRVGTQFKVMVNQKMGWCESNILDARSFPAFYVINDTLQATIKVRLAPSADSEEGSRYFQPGDVFCVYEKNEVNWLKIRLVESNGTLSENFYWVLRRTQSGIELAIPAVPTLFMLSPDLPLGTALRKRSCPSLTSSEIVDTFVGEYVLGVEIKVADSDSSWVWVCDTHRSFISMFSPDKSIPLLIAISDVNEELKFMSIPTDTLPEGTSLRIRKTPATTAEVVDTLCQADVVAVQKHKSEDFAEGWELLMVEPFYGAWCMSQSNGMETLREVEVVEPTPAVESVDNDKITETPSRNIGVDAVSASRGSTPASSPASASASASSYLSPAATPINSPMKATANSIVASTPIVNNSNSSNSSVHVNVDDIPITAKGAYSAGAVSFEDTPIKARGVYSSLEDIPITAKGVYSSSTKGPEDVPIKAKGVYFSSEDTPIRASGVYASSSTPSEHMSSTGKGTFSSQEEMPIKAKGVYSSPEDIPIKSKGVYSSSTKGPEDIPIKATGTYPLPFNDSARAPSSSNIVSSPVAQASTSADNGIQSAHKTPFVSRTLLASTPATSRVTMNLEDTPIVAKGKYVLDGEDLLPESPSKYAASGITTARKRSPAQSPAKVLVKSPGKGSVDHHSYTVSPSSASASPSKVQSADSSPTKLIDGKGGSKLDVDEEEEDMPFKLTSIDLNSISINMEEGGSGDDGIMVVDAEDEVQDMEQPQEEVQEQEQEQEPEEQDDVEGSGESTAENEMEIEQDDIDDDVGIEDEGQQDDDQSNEEVQEDTAMIEEQDEDNGDGDGEGGDVDEWGIPLLSEDIQEGEEDNEHDNHQTDSGYGDENQAELHHSEGAEEDNDEDRRLMEEDEDDILANTYNQGNYDHLQVGGDNLNRITPEEQEDDEYEPSEDGDAVPVSRDGNDDDRGPFSLHIEDFDGSDPRGNSNGGRESGNDNVFCLSMTPPKESKFVFLGMEEDGCQEEVHCLDQLIATLADSSCSMDLREQSTAAAESRMSRLCGIDDEDVVIINHASSCAALVVCQDEADCLAYLDDLPDYDLEADDISFACEY